ncbi:Tad domain-containing protein [Aminipila terrae]|uniref:Uncharacterized protein n=1 Tax=Aminipila terrae TaxID=2697030 RepID=A0A6P1M9C9_9FIRM|nr:Tad domain-containing protein [Aminipila terrae]QHI71339.1 hypothetical protein Ami3637_02040 [Aminipila terrae]
MNVFKYCGYREEQGSVTIMVALFITVLMAFTAIVIDVGRVALEKQQLQSAVDAACLAGAQELPDSIVAAKQKSIMYFEENGFDEEEIDQIEFVNSNKRIRITASHPVEYTFAKIFKREDNTKVSVSAAAECSSVFGPFKYALFSGSEMDLLQFKGQNIIDGNVHSNNSIKNAATVTGVVTAVNTIDAKVNASSGKIENSPYVSMPDFSDVLTLATTVNQSTLINVFGASFKASSNQYTMSAEQLNAMLSVYSTVFINGNLTINGSGIHSNGSILATGDMTFNGSNVSMNASDSVCFYSMNGNITFNGGSGDVTGILYAPKGTVRLNGNSGIFYGSIVGDLVTCDGGINLTYSSQAAQSVPFTITRLVE